MCKQTSLKQHGCCCLTILKCCIESVYSVSILHCKSVAHFKLEGLKKKKGFFTCPLTVLCRILQISVPIFIQSSGCTTARTFTVIVL